MKTGLVTRLLDTAAARRCHVCGARLQPADGVLCCLCVLHLPRTGHCQTPYDNPMARLLWGLLDIERAAAFMHYEPHSEVAALIYHIKYGGDTAAAVMLGYLAACEYAACGFFDDVDVIVPVPLEAGRQRQRGYNQSLLIARGVAMATGIAIDDTAVERLTFAGSQAGEHRWNRYLNVSGAFGVTAPDRLDGRHILLVDDVMTSGATVVACGTAIHKAAGVRLSVMTIALAGN